MSNFSHEEEPDNYYGQECDRLRAKLAAAEAKLAIAEKVINAIRNVKGGKIEMAAGKQWFYMPVSDWDEIKEATSTAIVKIKEPTNG